MNYKSEQIEPKFPSKFSPESRTKSVRWIDIPEGNPVSKVRGSKKICKFNLDELVCNGSHLYEKE